MLLLHSGDYITGGIDCGYIDVKTRAWSSSPMTRTNRSGLGLFAHVAAAEDSRPTEEKRPKQSEVQHWGRQRLPCIYLLRDFQLVSGVAWILIVWLLPDGMPLPLYANLHKCPYVSPPSNSLSLRRPPDVTVRLMADARSSRRAHRHRSVRALVDVPRAGA